MSGWSAFLDAAAPCDHGVLVYGDATELAASLATFLAAGLAVREPAIIVATPEHVEAVEEALTARGLDVPLLRAAGVLNVHDAVATLEALEEDGELSRERFDAVIGGAAAALAARHPGKTLRGFGEMVDILWNDGREDDAILLEGWWNELAADVALALLCAYRIDIFDLEVQRGLPRILHEHSHALPAADPARLAAAVDRALTDVVGPFDAARIYLDVARDHPLRGARGQAVLAWVSASLEPQRAKRVLGRARANYHALAATK